MGRADREVVINSGFAKNAIGVPGPGRSKTALTSYHCQAGETQNTLEFASRAMRVEVSLGQD